MALPVQRVRHVGNWGCLLDELFIELATVVIISTMSTPQSDSHESDLTSQLPVFGEVMDRISDEINLFKTGSS
ncbi:hypothetical protein TNCV_1214991 [Trichonephila clavipes]|nr:hypothetical protein TNCV_1214991 [Trichonephila clavipes]